VGIGASYIWEDTDFDSINVFGTLYEPDVDDTLGINVKIGGHVTNWMALEMDFAYLSETEWNELIVVSGTPIKIDFHAEVWTLMLLTKFSADIGTGMPKPFLVAGGGLMYVEGGGGRMMRQTCVSNWGLGQITLQRRMCQSDSKEPTCGASMTSKR